MTNTLFQRLPVGLPSRSRGPHTSARQADELRLTPGRREGGLSQLAGQVARRALFRLCERLARGSLTVVEGSRRTTFGVKTDGGPHVTLFVASARFYSACALRGSIGLCESYMQRDVECDDLVGLVRLWLQNRHVMDAMDFGFARISQPLYQLNHLLRRNTKSGASRNIRAHYDLGNEFYRLFLDETLCYSAGIYETETSTLYDASLAKLERSCRKLGLTAGDRLLEIGSGWGALALHAAGEYGCHVTTITLSHEQQRLASERVKAAGLSDRVQVVLQDYRDVRGRFDKLVSIEMIEAVGHHYLGAFFERCSDLLEADGQMLLQSITICDQRYAAARDGVDFIKHYIFPGSHIPSVNVLAAAVAKHSDMKIVQLEDITPHYARTLAHWRARFNEQRAAVREQGFDDAFIRMWDLYLAYCEAGFSERFIGDVQLLLHKPECRALPPLPALSSKRSRAFDSDRAPFAAE